MAPLYWRLAYADDHIEDEPEDNASILFSRPGAVRLFAMRADGKGGREPMFAVWLFDQESGQTFKPIFYRRRSVALDEKEVKLDATVVGRGTIEVKPQTRAQRRQESLHGGDKRADVQFDGALWASTDGQSFVDAPEKLIDRDAITNLLVNSA